MDYHEKVNQSDGSGNRKRSDSASSRRRDSAHPPAPPTTSQHMHAPRRSELSHELTPEERSRGGRMRAAKIYTAKAEAAAEGRPYKRLRRRRASSFGRDPYASPAWREGWSTMEQQGAESAEYVPESLRELTDEEVAAEARAFWLDDLCERRDAEHDEGPDSFVLYE
jgi:hypothetical protein